MAISKQVVATNLHTNEIRRGRLGRGKQGVKMEEVVQSHLHLVVEKGVKILISSLLLTTHQKELQPERQFQSKTMILSSLFGQ